jgi:hypothetical protein
MKEYIVELQYFKESGKYYSEGIYKTTKTSMFGVIDEVRDMCKYKDLPEVCCQFPYIHIEIKDEECMFNYPCLIITNNI